MDAKQVWFVSRDIDENDSSTCFGIIACLVDLGVWLKLAPRRPWSKNGLETPNFTSVRMKRGWGVRGHAGESGWVGHPTYYCTVTVWRDQTGTVPSINSYVEDWRLLIFFLIPLSPLPPHARPCPALSLCLCPSYLLHAYSWLMMPALALTTRAHKRMGCITKWLGFPPFNFVNKLSR